jgi:GT2 family glycosyltransferase
LNAPVLTVVILNYNVEHFLEICLDSVLAASRNLDVEIRVVDNHSSDGSVEMVRRKFPDVILTANTENLGFSRGNNLAIAQSRGKYVLLLNPDTIVPEDGFEKCLAYMEANPDVGGLGCRMIDGSGHFLPESKRGLPSPWVSFCKAFGLARLFPKSPRFGKYHLSYLAENEIHEVDVLSGAFMWMRRDVLEKTGYLDEDFFMYGEDVDLSYRIQLAGFKNVYFPDCTILHFKGESTKRGSISFVQHFYKAMLLFSQKHFKGNILFSWFIYVGIGVRAILALGKRAWDFSASFLVEFGIAFAGMKFIKDWWELNFKGVPGMYPDFFIHLLIPVYLLVWIGWTRIFGRYSREFNHGSILKGIAMGTILISGITNFFDDYRFSKGLILIGAVWTWLVVSLRFVLQRIAEKKSPFGEDVRKNRILLWGPGSVFERVSQFLGSRESGQQLAGWVWENPGSDVRNRWLGKPDGISELLYRLGIKELVFSTQSLSYQEIIQQLDQLSIKKIRFAFLGKDASFVISSSEKHNRGTIFQSETIPEALQAHHLRQKRLFDLVICFILVLGSPFLLLTGRLGFPFIRNWWSVCFGKKSWVGLSHSDFTGHGMRKGIISMTDLAGPGADQGLVQSLDFMYLNEFHPEQEIWTVLKNTRLLNK